MKKIIKLIIIIKNFKIFAEEDRKSGVWMYLKMIRRRLIYVLNMKQIKLSGN